MAFLKKIEKPKVESDADLEKKREKFISGGGLVIADVANKESDEEKWLKILLRIRSDLVDEIDTLIKNRVGLTRTGWILEAIQEKIKRTTNE